MYQAFVNNENFPEVVLRFFTQDVKGTGKEIQNYTIKLTNATISSIVDDMANNKIVENAKLPILEIILFTYQKIEWTWVDGGITATDNWEIK